MKVQTVRVLETWKVDELTDVFPSQALGGLSYQCFHQRTLAASSSAKAKITCYAAAGILPLVFGLPPILLGAAASSTGKEFRVDGKYHAR